MESELNNQKKKQEILNLLEKKCEGLENMLCKNVLNTISKKIESIEKNFSTELINETPIDNQNEDNKILNEENEEISMISENLNIIQNSFNSNLTSCDSKFSDIINRKIEENYMLLNELEKSNRPIFTKTTEINNTMFVEDKIKEMDDKLSELFKSENAKNYSARNIDVYTNSKSDFTINIRGSYNFEKTNDTILEKKPKDPANEKVNAEIGREIKKKELYDKLTNTEKRIKEIAGSLLKNF